MSHALYIYTLCLFNAPQRLIREEWEALQAREREEEEKREKAKREKEVTICFAEVTMTLIELISSIHHAPITLVHIVVE